MSASKLLEILGYKSRTGNFRNALAHLLDFNLIEMTIPKSLAMQWVAEMNTHFNEAFALINPGDLDALKRLECSTPISTEQRALQIITPG